MDIEKAPTAVVAAGWRRCERIGLGRAATGKDWSRGALHSPPSLNEWECELAHSRYCVGARSIRTNLDMMLHAFGVLRYRCACALCDNPRGWTWMDVGS